jgi:hypothetical protein
MTDFFSFSPAAFPYPIHTVKAAFADGVDFQQYFPVLATVYCVCLQTDKFEYTVVHWLQTLPAENLTVSPTTLSNW